MRQYMPRMAEVEKALAAASSAARITGDTPANSPLRAAALLRDEILNDWIRHGLTRRQIAQILDVGLTTVYTWCNPNEQRKRRDSYRAATAVGEVPLHSVITDLAKRRVELGLSVPDVARGIGVNAETLLGWERGEVGPRLDNLIEWAGWLGLRIAAVPREDGDS